MTSRTLTRVLFAGPLEPFSTTLGRLQALRAMGLDVDPLDTAGWLPPGPRPLRSLVQRSFLHPAVARMNRRLAAAAEGRAYDAVWIEKGQWVFPGTLAAVRRTGAALVHYNTDDVFGRYAHLWLHRRGLRHYDLCLTTNRHNVVELRDRGVPCLRVGMGYDAELHRPRDVPHRERPQAVFVGHWEPHTEAGLAALLDAGIEVGLWGENWRRARDRRWRGAVPLRGEAYAEALAAAPVALGFLSRWNRNESTVRSFEIPAAGTLLLAERTLEHEHLYGDGRAAALFSTRQELVAKARHYLAHPAERTAVAAAGRERVARLGCSWSDHLRREWPLVERWLARPGCAFAPADDAPFWPGFRAGAPPPAGA